MKSNMIAACLITTCCLAANSALAADMNTLDSIKGRVGVTGRLGFSVPADSDAVVFGTPNRNNNTDTGFIGGGGVIYGFTDNIAAELDITHASYGTNTSTDFDTTNISLGVQYRFLNLPVKRLIPYAGGGLDILVNGANNGLDVDTVVGVHIQAGVDYYLMKQLALTSEIKGVLASNADITYPGIGKVGEFDPNSFSTTIGVRYFFN